MKNEGRVLLDIHTVPLKRSLGAGKGNLIPVVQKLIDEKAIEGVPVLLYLRDLDECRKVEKKIT